jgi:hypothetical protein
MLLVKLKKKAFLQKVAVNERERYIANAQKMRWKRQEIVKWSKLCRLSSSSPVP